MTQPSVWPPPPDNSVAAAQPETSDIVDALIDAPKNRPVPDFRLAVALGGIAGRQYKDPFGVMRSRLAARSITGPVVSPEANPKATDSSPIGGILRVLVYAIALVSFYPRAVGLGGPLSLLVVAFLSVGLFLGVAGCQVWRIVNAKSTDARRDEARNPNRQYDPVLRAILTRLSDDPFPMRKTAVALQGATGLTLADAMAVSRSYCRRSGLPDADGYAWRLQPIQWIAGTLAFCILSWTRLFGSVAPSHAAQMAIIETGVRFFMIVIVVGVGVPNVVGLTLDGAATARLKRTRSGR